MQDEEMGDAVGENEGDVGVIDGAVVGKVVIAEGAGVFVNTVAVYTGRRVGDSVGDSVGDVSVG
jgi:hypothetical protein